MEPVWKRIKLEDGEPSFSATQSIVVDAPIKEGQLSDEDDSDSGESGSECSGSEESDSEGSEGYQSCESGGEEEIKPEPQTCPGCCEKQFTSYSSMMEHLENGTCKSGCTPRLVESVVATHCEGLHPSSSLNINLRCPTCKKKNARMSPLFRHVENRSCALRDWINETGLLDLLMALFEAIEKKKPSTFPY